MSKDLDEDLIDATIRRVQAQKLEPRAAEGTSGPKGSATPSGSVEETPEAEYASASMDRIQDTILRVKAQAAAMRDAQDESPPAASHEAVEEDPIEATIRRVQAQADAAHNVDETADVPNDGQFDDEDPIEATIRRVQAQAMQDLQSDPASTDEADASRVAEESLIEATIRRVQEQSADTEVETALSMPISEVDHVEAAIRIAEADPDPVIVAQIADEQPIEVTAWPGRDERMLGEPDSWQVAAQRLEQGLQDTQRDVRSLAARLGVTTPGA